MVHSIDLGSKIEAKVPGSKSITNRALLMAALADGATTLSGVLFSDDSRIFMDALKQLGFDIDIDEEQCRVTIVGLGGRIPHKEEKIYVGSAGTAARFLTAYLGMSEGVYVIDASSQMKKRPMRELLDALVQLGAKIQYLGTQKTFPFQITGIGHLQDKKKLPDKQIDLNIDRSSQFLSALLMTAPIRFESLTIHLTGRRTARSYVSMTEKMMKQFGHPGVRKVYSMLSQPIPEVMDVSKNKIVEKQVTSIAEIIARVKAQMDTGDFYRVTMSPYQALDYTVEPDVSAACYFYAIAALTGGSAVVKNMRLDSLQGDMRFLDFLNCMGCTLIWNDGQLVLKGPVDGMLQGITADMSDCSDQALTMAAIAPYAQSPVTVTGVSHIREQECDRLFAIQENMRRMQVPCEIREDGFTIYPSQPQAAALSTFHDHRVAMSFALTGLRARQIEILDPDCCAKTFEKYFQQLDQIIQEHSSMAKLCL